MSKTKTEQALIEARLTGHALSSLQGDLKRFREGLDVEITSKTEDDTYVGELPDSFEEQRDEIIRQSNANRRNATGIRYQIEAMSKEREQLRRARGWMT